MSQPILVWGGGAIGGTLAASFSRAGKDVVLVDTDAEHVRAVSLGGLQVHGPIFEDTVKLPAFVPEEIDGCFERIFLCVKAHHTITAIASLEPHLAANGYVVSAQNGLNENVIAEIVGTERTLGCFVNFDADYLRPGVVHYSGHGAVVIGELDGKQSTRVNNVHRLLQNFEPTATTTDNIWGYLWGKLIYGTLLFATALTDDSIADVFDNRAHRPVLTYLANEVATIAAASNVRLESFDGFDPAAFAPDAPHDKTAQSFADMVAHNRRSLKSHSGIWRDLKVRKRKTEVDAQIAPIVEIGQKVGVPAPLTSRIITMIHEIETGHRILTPANLDELMQTRAEA